MKNLTINWLAVLVCAVMAQIIGIVWYVIVFNTQWMSLNGFTMEAIKDRASNTPYLISFIASLIQAFVLAWLFTKLKVENVKDGLMYGLVIGFGFIVLNFLTLNMFSFRPIALALIDAGNDTLAVGVFGAILGYWKKYA